VALFNARAHARPHTVTHSQSRPLRETLLCPLCLRKRTSNGYSAILLTGSGRCRRSRVSNFAQIKACRLRRCFCSRWRAADELIGLFRSAYRRSLGRANLRPGLSNFHCTEIAHQRRAAGGSRRTSLRCRSFCAAGRCAVPREGQEAPSHPTHNAGS
jgi:hypothetical protein